MIDLARNVARVFQAGAQTIPMENATLRVPRLTQDATGGWYNEAQDIISADGTFDGVTFTARKLAVILAIDNELLEDARTHLQRWRCPSPRLRPLLWITPD